MYGHRRAPPGSEASQPAEASANPSWWETATDLAMGFGAGVGYDAGMATALGAVGQAGSFVEVLGNIAGNINWDALYDEGYYEGLGDTEGFTPMPEAGEWQRPSDISEFTPEYVEAHRDQLGIPPGAPIDDFFHEFVAHQVTGTTGRRSDRLDQIMELPEGEERDAALETYQQERDVLESWGYDPDVSEENEVYDPETGLYAVRYDPSEEGLADGRQSVVSFRGTQPGEGVGDGTDHGWGQDLFTDLDPEVGQRQFDANSAEIGELMAGGTGADGNSVVTGHSLGGYLAQRAAAEYTDTVSDVVTFQAGGISDEHAAQFEENSDGRVDVRHHTTNYDFVNWAGEQKLDGTHFEHVTDDFSAGNFGHLRGLMFGVENDANVLALLDGQVGTSESEVDPIDPAWRHLSEGVRTGVGGLGRVAGATSKGYGAYADGMLEMWDNAYDGASDTAGALFDGLGTTGDNALDALADTGSELWDLDFWGAASEAGSGLGQLGTDLWDTAADTGGSALDTLGGMVMDTGGAMWDGLSTTSEQLAIGGGQLWSAAEHFGAGLSDYAGRTSYAQGMSAAVDNLAVGAQDTAGSLWDGLSTTGSNLWDSAGDTASALGSGDVLGAGWSALSGVGQAHVDLGSTALDTLGGAASTAGGWISDTSGAAWDGATGAVDAAGELWDEGIGGFLWGR